MKMVNLNQSVETLAKQAIELDGQIKDMEAQLTAIKTVLLEKIGVDPILVPELEMRVSKRANQSSIYDVAAIGAAFAKAKQTGAFYGMINLVAKNIPATLDLPLKKAIELYTTKGALGKPYIVIDAMSAADKAKSVEAVEEAPKKRKAK